MIRRLAPAFAASLCLLTVRPAGAGLYNTDERPQGPGVTAEGVEPIPFTYFRQDILQDLLQVAVEQPVSPLRAQALKRTAELQAKEKARTLTPEERVNRAAYLIRLRKSDEAVTLLMPVAAQERRNFMLFANLALAYQQTGQLVRAREYQTMVLDVWPREWPGLAVEQMRWLRRAEEFHLKLLRLRSREAAAQQGRSKPPETVDDLFGVRFVGENGEYVAGQLDAAEKAKLPPDAIAIVQQLLVWLPEDTRLYWLYGELLNAQGDISAAAQVFEDCVWSRRFDATALREHRQIVQAALPKPVPESGPNAWMPDTTRLIGVGVAVGLLIVALIYWQVRELRRRGAAARGG